MNQCQLIYFEGCPNAKHARAILLSLGIDFDVILQDKLEKNDEYRNYSSPSIIKDGKLILGQRLAAGSSACSFENINEKKLRKSLLEKNAPVVLSKGNRKKPWAFLGSFGSALTVGLCPVCIPAVGSFLSSIGLGFLVSEAILRPVLIVFLLIALSGLFWSYFKEHQNIFPFLMGLLMASSIYIGRYVYINGAVNMVLMYGGIAGVIGVSIWNWRLRKQINCSSCRV